MVTVAIATPKISFDTFAIDFLLRDWRNKDVLSEDWITLQQIPLRFLGAQCRAALHAEAWRIAAIYHSALNRAYQACHRAF
jgi:hypothetical protein